MSETTTHVPEDTTNQMLDGGKKDNASKPHKSRFDIGGVTFRAESPPNLPGYLKLEHLFEDREPKADKNYPGLGFSFRPNELDKIPAGTFTLKRWMRKPGLRLPFPYRQEITVRESDFGKVVDLDSFGTTNMVERNTNPDTLPLKVMLGYEAKDGKIIGIPTPETIKKAAQAVGFPVELVGAGDIPPELYLAVRGDGKYPVATTDERFWGHDIDIDNHIGAEVAAGEPLRVSFQRVANDCLRNGLPSDMDSTANGIDWYSSLVGAVVLDKKDVFDADQQEITSASGRSLLIKAGEKIGITSEETNHIIATAQDNFNKYGVPIRQLA